MSAFVVGHDHIDALISFAIQRQPYGCVSYYWDNQHHGINEQTATETGRKLLTENVRSVEHRYPDSPPDDLPGTIGEDVANYNFKLWHLPPLTPVVILKACSCFDYQACETDDYDQSEAHAIIDAIRERAIGQLPGYDNAPGWELRRSRPIDDPPKVMPRSGASR